MSIWIKRMLLAGLAPLVLLGLLEVILRVADLGYPTSFLVPDRAAGGSVYRENPFFGYRFFPPRMTRMAMPIRVDRNKAPGALRVVVLGESAALGEPQPEFGLARFLECLLRARYPDRPVEVINAAMTAINSHVVVEIASELADFQPDVVVLYMGNNEVVGPYGPGTVLSPATPLARVRVLAGRLRLAQLLRAVWPGASWSGMSMFLDRTVAADDARLGPVYDGFRANLRRIMGAVEGAGARLALCTVAVNLKDCAPFAGESARMAYQQGRWEEARDLDTLRFRADSTINRILREAGSQAGPRVIPVDAAALFGLTGREDFSDHVHFTVAGSYRLARAIAEAVAPEGSPWPDRDACLRALAYTLWAEWDLVDNLIRRREGPPFTGQPGNAAQLVALREQLAVLREQLAVADRAEVETVYRAALRDRPDDWYLYTQWSEVLMNEEAYSESGQVLEKALALAPHRFDTRSGLALLLGYLGRADEAVRMLGQAPEPHGHFVTEFLLSTARNLARDRYLKEALVLAEAALAESPRNDDVRVEVAIRNAALGRKSVAEEQFRKALQRKPSHRQARDEFAAFLALQRRWDEALAVLLGAGLDPETRLKQAQLLMARGDWAGADRVLRELEATGDLADEVAALRARWSRLSRP